jgi:hypothetical protein
MATCPNCQTQIEWGAPECVACGATFEAARAWRPVPQSAEEARLITAKYPAKLPEPLPSIGSVFKSALFLLSSIFLAIVALVYAVSGNSAPPVSSAFATAAVYAVLTVTWYLALLLLVPLFRFMFGTAGFLAGLLVGLTFFLPGLVYYKFADPSLGSALTGYSALWAVIGFFAVGWLLIPITAVLAWIGGKLFLAPSNSTPNTDARRGGARRLA